MRMSTTEVAAALTLLSLACFPRVLQLRLLVASRRIETSALTRTKGEEQVRARGGAFHTKARAACDVH
eukprot:13241643-Alexandrium_andersonii.AAC.1